MCGLMEGWVGVGWGWMDEWIMGGCIRHWYACMYAVCTHIRMYEYICIYARIYIYVRMFKVYSAVGRQVCIFMFFHCAKWQGNSLPVRQVISNMPPVARGNSFKLVILIISET